MREEEEKNLVLKLLKLTKRGTLKKQLKSILK